MSQTPTGTVVGVTDGGRPIILEEGPAWLAALVYDPPAWVPFVAALAGLCVVAGVLLVWRRFGRPDDDALHEAAANGLTVLFAIATVTGLQAAVAWPYLADVLVGGILAWVLAVVGVRSVVKARSNA